MANSTPITIPVSSTSPPAPLVSVANLGRIARTFVLTGDADARVEIWGANVDEEPAPLENRLILASANQNRSVQLGNAANQSDMVTVDDGCLFYGARRLAGTVTSLTVTGEDVGLSPASDEGVARNVGPAANVNLAAFVLAGNDGVNNVLGDVVFLYAQALPQQNGPYVIDTVTGPTGTLRRPSWWQTGSTIQPGSQVYIREGTDFRGVTWQSFALVPVIVGITDPVVVPLVFSRQVTLVAGAATIGAIPILSAVFAPAITRRTPIATALTVQYNMAAVTPGAFGLANVGIQAEDAAGALNANDLSVLNVTIVQG